MNILHLIPYYQPAWAYGGSTRVAVELCRRLAARGHEVTVLTTDALDADNRASTPSEVIDGVRVQRIRNFSNRLAWRRLFLPLGYRQAGSPLIQAADVVHVHEARSLLNAAASRPLNASGTPFILMPHGSLPRELGRSALKSIYDWLWGHRFLDRACRLHALTAMEQSQYFGMDFPSEKIILIPNGVDRNAFNTPVDEDAFRRRFNIPIDAPVVGFLGRLNPIKGLDFLVSSFAEIAATHPRAILLIAGPDDGARTDLEAQVHRLGLAEHVRFTGMLTEDTDKAAAYRVSDVYVLPSRYENLPTTVLEALLNETPCIVTDRCGLALQLAEGCAIPVVSFGDTTALTAIIQQLLDQPKTARQLAQDGRKFVKENFDWDTITDRWLDAYQACLDTSPLNR